MPSPFPGFDPYLEDERFWHDFHQRFIAHTADWLSVVVPLRYRIRIEERALVMTEPPKPSQRFERVIYPDIAISRQAPQPTGTATATVTALEVETEVVADEPVIVEFMAETERRQSFIKIIDRTNERLVTVIELLSPSNKRTGEWRTAYLQKQFSYLEGGVNLVEIDLLRQGKHTVAVPEYSLERIKPFYGIVSVWRFHIRHRFEVYPVRLQERLPRIAVPLLPEDKDVVLDIQWVFNRCYDLGRYGLDIDYTQPPPVPLTDEEKAWLEKLLQEKGLRKAESEGT